jgi:uncharacterized protein YbjT (DUF2867 family)
LIRPGREARIREPTDGISPSPDGQFEIAIGDALKPSTLADCMLGIDTVFSCLGQTVSADLSITGPGYRDVDVPANLNLLQAAVQSGARRFVYVSVLNAEKFPKVAYLDAHAQVAGAVKSSGLSFGILQPTGFFSAFRAAVEMVKKNQAVLFGDGSAQSNPIADEDLAEACVDSIMNSESGDIPIGGPEVYTRREILELAHRALGKPLKIRQLPLWVPALAGGMARPFAPRVADLMSFVHVISSHDFVAPARGVRRIESFFEGEAISGPSGTRP